ncbi:protein E16A [Elephant endotheliotropic herpesvirus 1A]|uniref:Protein E16A n=1 Tax=Elephant endotheliotropic herpesvirus 1A TaxID=759753 RepID=A0A866VV37_ELHV1|nr:protein E16A [Elephant endotheliotropic herpesvirus 1A]QOE74658.1 protein E16A [Elephant endotheliotropic herpesvirus 1A]QOE75107.1 protein E16A [Elephant endotheliotropic herpesvirus 1A]QYM88434.1 protein E16A [Elephant endotheliotropic herpesvirus 1A]WNZ34585.1 protein E16A [Elephant endotheliotropic herpesvirus 1A]
MSRMLSSAFIKKVRLTKELITLFFLNQYPVHGANITLQSLCLAIGKESTSLFPLSLCEQRTRISEI